MRLEECAGTSHTSKLSSSDGSSSLTPLGRGLPLDDEIMRLLFVGGSLSSSCERFLDAMDVENEESLSQTSYELRRSADESFDGRLVGIHSKIILSSLRKQVILATVMTMK